jgi:hypothetical protein
MKPRIKNVNKSESNDSFHLRNTLTFLQDVAHGSSLRTDNTVMSGAEGGMTDLAQLIAHVAQLPLWVDLQQQLVVADEGTCEASTLSVALCILQDRQAPGAGLRPA